MNMRLRRGKPVAALLLLALLASLTILAACAGTRRPTPSPTPTSAPTATATATVTPTPTPTVPPFPPMPPGFDGPTPAAASFRRGEAARAAIIILTPYMAKEG